MSKHNAASPPTLLVPPEEVATYPAEFGPPDYSTLLPVSSPAPEAAGAAPEHPKSRLHRLARGTGKTAVYAAMMLPVAGIGAAGAIIEVPATINAGPGISAEVSPMLANYSGLSYGFTLGAPKLHASVAGVDMGINIKVTKLDTHESASQDQTLPGLPEDRSASQDQTLAAILDNPEGTLGEGVKNAMLWRAGEGGGAAILAVGAGGLLERRRRRRRRAEAASEQQQIDRLENRLKKTALPAEVLDESRDELAGLRQKRQQRESHQLRRKWTAAAAAASVLATGGYQMAHKLTPPSGSRTVIFPKNSNNPYIRDILAEAPILEGGFVTGDAGYYAKQGLLGIVRQLERVNQYWSSQANYLASSVLPTFLATNKLPWLHDPNYVGFVQLTDIHDNRSYLKYFLPTVLQTLADKMHVQFIVNTGDEENYSGKYVLDDGAQQRMADALPTTGPNGAPMEEVDVAGNHDQEDGSDARKAAIRTTDGKTIHPIVPLDKSDDYTTTVDGVTFVGAPDLNRTTIGTVPADSEGQMKNDAKQGELIAQRACDIYQKTGQRPIVLGHEPESTYAADASGCTSISLNGHTHVTTPLQAFLNKDGSITYRQTLGSSSGDGPNNVTAIYNKATATASISIWYYNKVTGESKEIMISVDPSSDLPTMQLVTPERAIPVSQDTFIPEFAKQYDPNLLTRPQPEASHNNQNGWVADGKGH